MRSKEQREKDLKEAKEHIDRMRKIADGQIEKLKGGKEWKK